MKCGKAEDRSLMLWKKKGWSEEGALLGIQGKGYRRAGCGEAPPTGVGIFPGECSSQKCELKDRVSSESSSTFCH